MSSPQADSKISFNKPLAGLIQTLINDFDKISDERKRILQQLTEYILAQTGHNNKKVKLLFICTHNSRRSHIAQIWAQAAAAYYGIPGVESYSGGTEATAFNLRAVKAMQDAGFKIDRTASTDNPVYEVHFADGVPPVTTFSKKYDSKTNPQKGFAAVMTCSHADENCPVVLGMEKRISLPYNDPKDYDETPQEREKYTERVKEIGTEVLYAFSQVIPKTISGN